MADSRRRSLAAIAISVAALAVIAGALLSGGDTVRTEAERADHIASRLRCPFCNGESIADATAQVARDLEVVIREQVAEGKTDDEIFDFFAERYGESLLLEPPFLGWGWALWALPLAALLVGGTVALRRRRGSGFEPVHAGSDLESARIREQLEFVSRDRVEVAEQQTRGELDVGTAAALGAALDAEEDALSQALRDEDGESPERVSPAGNRRVAAGVTFVLVGVIAIGATLLLMADDEGDGGIVDAPPIDLATITSERLEEVVAANPDVIPMRLFLAQMLMDEGEVARAAVHFGAVLEREQNPEAMAWIGYISFLAEQYDTAEGFLEDALAIEPDYPQAQWWLANVRVLGLDDPAGAIGPLEDLLGSPGVPEDVKLAAEEMLRQAREQS
jgi:cytochrome c-type biogenesis protein CcmH/NrfF